MRILVIEDEQAIAHAIKKRLKHTYVIDVAYTGKSGSHLAEVCDYDLIILDLHLPDMSGTEICRKIRANRITTPILILTGESNVDNKVKTLDAGADDYLVKPFDFSELSARIRALLRRNPVAYSSNLLIIADMTLDPVRRLVVRGDKIIRLRRKEFDLLEYLVRNKGKVLKREMILEHVWEDEHQSYTNIVDVHIKYLRDQIDRPFPKHLIKTVHGLGYRLDG